MFAFNPPSLASGYAPFLAVSAFPAAAYNNFLSVVQGTEPDVIVRRVTSRADGMFGVMLIQDEDRLGHLPLCLTCEDPWLLNKPGVSCSPAGVYNASLYNSPKFKAPLYRLLSVPGREFIEIHWGNTNRDTEGCILLGSSFGTVSGITAVINSRPTFDLFMRRMKGAAQFTISIEDMWGGSTAVLH